MKVVEGSEILTSSGWKNISEIDRDLVVTIQEDGEVSFKKMSSRSAGVSSTGKLYSKTSEFLFSQGSSTIVKDITTGITFYHLLQDKINYKFDVVRSCKKNMVHQIDPKIILACAIQADGSYNTTSNGGRSKSYWEVQFSRKEKIDRFTFALDGANVIYTKYDPDKRARVKFYIPHYKEDLFTGDIKEKNFDLDKIISHGVGNQVLEEAKHWDGSLRNSVGSWTYCSTNLHNIGVIQALAHLNGNSANYGVQYDKRLIFKTTPKPYYRLNVSNKTTYFNFQTRRYADNGTMKVFELSTELCVMVRQNGYVYIVK